MLAAIALTAPVGAEEINAPQLRRPAAMEENAPAAGPAIVNQAQAGGAAENVTASAEAPQDSAQAAAQSANQPATLPDNPPSHNQAGTEAKKAADDQKNEEQKKSGQESHERALGMMPMFTVVDDASTAQPLSPREKFRLFYRQTYDPYQFFSAGISAGIGQAEDSLSGYGQGAQGYGKRYGATLADNSLGAFFGNFLLPTLMHEDPRFFRMGSGGFMHRLLHAAGSQLIAHRDNGTIGPAYANVMGNFIACGIGNVYYPASDRGAGTTIERGALVTTTGMIGAVFQEFWPDIQRHLSKKTNTAK